MRDTPDSKKIISDLDEKFEAQVDELRKIRARGCKLRSPKDLAELEKKIQAHVKALGDTVAGIKLQEELGQPEQQNAEQELVKVSRRVRKPSCPDSLPEELYVPVSRHTARASSDHLAMLGSRQ